MTKPRLTLLLASLAPLAACTPAQMQVPADIAAQAEIVQVTNRSRVSGALANESFTFGPWAIDHVNRKWSSGGTLTIGNWSSGHAVGGYSFVFTGPGGTSQGQCATEHAKDSKGIGFGFSVESQMAKIGCSCQGVGANGWVVLDSPEQKGYVGQVQTRALQGDMRSLHTMVGSNLRNTAPLGYELRTQNAAAALDINHPGKAWFSSSLDSATRADTACLFAGLLLYQPPRAD
jgi:hypothetical protein